MAMKLVSADSLNLGGSDLFKMQQGQTYRLSFAMNPGFEKSDLDFEKAPLFAQANSLFIKGIGKVIDEGPHSEISGEASKEYFATVIVVWPITRKNSFDKTRLLEDEDFDVAPFRVTAGRLKDIKAAYALQGVPFGSRDLIMLCTDAKFQSANYSACPDSVLSMLQKASKSDDEAHAPAAAIFSKIMEKTLKESENLENIFGKRMSVEDFTQKLGELNKQNSSDSSGDLISGAVPPAASAPEGLETTDVDDLIDEL